MNFEDILIKVQDGIEVDLKENNIDGFILLLKDKIHFSFEDMEYLRTQDKHVIFNDYYRCKIKAQMLLNTFFNKIYYQKCDVDNAINISLDSQNIYKKISLGRYSPGNDNFEVILKDIIIRCTILYTMLSYIEAFELNIYKGCSKSVSEDNCCRNKSKERVSKSSSCADDLAICLYCESNIMNGRCVLCDHSYTKKCCIYCLHPFNSNSNICKYCQLQSN